MRNLLFFLPFIFLISACTKEVVTKEGPVTTTSTPQSNTQNQVEGTINGGGGKGVLCKKGDVSSVETLDLYEARVLYGLDINEKATTQEEAMDLFTTVLTRHLWNPSTMPMEEYKKGFREQVANFLLKNIKFISRGKKLKLVNDSFEPLVEEGCEMVQVAVYYDESILLVDQSLWDQMNWTSKIGLLAHEIIYFMDRQNGSRNSISTRKLVGQLFSSKGARPKADGIPTGQNKYTSCFVSDKNISVGYFYAYNSSNPNPPYESQTGVEFVFNFLKNNDFLFRTSAFFSGVSIADIFKDSPNINSESPLYVDSYSPRQSLHVTFAGGGKAKMLISDGANGSISSELDISCRRLGD